MVNIHADVPSEIWHTIISHGVDFNSLIRISKSLHSLLSKDAEKAKQIYDQFLNLHNQYTHKGTAFEDPFTVFSKRIVLGYFCENTVKLTVSDNSSDNILELDCDFYVKPQLLDNNDWDVTVLREDNLDVHPFWYYVSPATGGCTYTFTAKIKKIQITKKGNFSLQQDVVFGIAEKSANIFYLKGPKKEDSHPKETHYSPFTYGFF